MVRNIFFIPPKRISKNRFYQAPQRAASTITRILPTQMRRYLVPSGHSVFIAMETSLHGHSSRSTVVHLFHGRSFYIVHLTLRTFFSLNGRSSWSTDIHLAQRSFISLNSRSSRSTVVHLTQQSFISLNGRSSRSTDIHLGQQTFISVNRH